MILDPPIPITLPNRVRIEQVLHKANSRSRGYKVVDFEHLLRLVDVAELTIDRILPSPAWWDGARAVVRADSTLPKRDSFHGRRNEYQLSQPTRMTLITLGHTGLSPLRNRGWELCEIRRARVRYRREVQCDLTLTPRQREIALGEFEALFRTRPYNREEVLAIDENARFVPRDELDWQKLHWLDEHAKGWRLVPANHPDHGLCWALLFPNPDDAFHFEVRWHAPKAAA
jgi:hypothetical protein